MFKKIAISALLVGLVGCAHAVDGTTTVSGTVTSVTCTITPSTTALVLPTVSKTSLASAGMTAGATPWSVSVSACSTATMNTFFEPAASGNTINSNGRLNTSIANVDLQVLTSAFGVVNLRAASGSQGPTAVALSGNAGTQQFYVRYYATGTASAGSFTNTTSFTFTLIYT